jgi:hypothetical protein
MCGVPRGAPATIVHNHRRFSHAKGGSKSNRDGEYGVEAQILRDGEVLVGYRFPTRAMAVQWALRRNENREKPKA